MNYRPEVILSWKVCVPSTDEFNLILSKIEAIVDNVEAIYDYSSPPKFGKINPDQLLKIEVDCDEDPETFVLFVCPTSDGDFPYSQKDSKVSFGMYEVVDSTIARSNDADFNTGRRELGVGFDYVLGEINSEYTKLGNSCFYYRYL
jgi:hypothetical protein